ncbi:hypothetical protein [Streptomyces sp. CT34]|uniref:hypothetical protein n=1 Tax=Streptomyces sp. CT34 TaxID=1553907 RepID=UPI000A900075|nr:hypothetical protein [Streptomyces sp. CT34]
MRPRLRDDVRYVQSPDGVFLQGDGGRCIIKGQNAYEWLSRLAPYLTGEHELEDLVGGLQPDKRGVVEELVRTLSEHRLLVDARQDEPHSLNAEEQQTYAAEIAFIRYATDSAERRFQRLREARIVLRGSGAVLSALLEAGLRSGWREVQVLAPEGELADLRQTAERARRDGAQEVRCGVPGEPGQTADVALHIGFSPADLMAASEDCGTATGQVLLGSSEVWLTPVGRPEVVEARSCWQRLTAQRFVDPEPAADVDWLTGPTPAIVAAHVVLSCFSYLTGLDALPRPEESPRPPALTRIDLRTLATRTHPVRPLRPRPADDPQRLPQLAAGAVLARDQLLEQAGSFIDAWTGVLGSIDEQELTQVPLSVCRATLSDPLGLLPAWSPAPSVMGWGRDRSTAWLRSLLAALTTYGTLTVAEGSAWGLDLLSGQPRAVPAPRADTRVPYRAAVGAAAGLSWSDAVAAGLRAHCESLLAERAGAEPLDAGALVREVDDEPARQLLRLLEAAGQSVEITDLGGVLGIPGYGCRSGGRAMVTTCAASAAEAVRDGLERTLLAWQTRTEGQGLGEPLVCRWPVGLTDPQPGSPLDDPRCRTLAEALRRTGRTPVAVPLGGDGQVAELLPYVVQVVLCDD